MKTSDFAPWYVPSQRTRIQVERWALFSLGMIYLQAASYATWAGIVVLTVSLFAIMQPWRDVPWAH